MRSPADAAGNSAGNAPYDGLSAEELRQRLALPRIAVFSEVGSTLDVAHALAVDGAPAGTLVLADAQTQGRGRAGRSWRSQAGAGVWLTLIERPRDARALDVASLRVGLGVGPALDRFAGGRVGLKWPNDLYYESRKLGGILVEARWRDGAPEWIAIGVGINSVAPAEEAAAIGLAPGTSRLTVLEAVIPAIRRAVARPGHLDDAERSAFDERDIAKGRRCSSPAEGTVCGIDACGALLVDIGSETIALRSGSLVFTEEEGR